MTTNQKEPTFRIKTTGKEKTAEEVFFGEPGLANVIPNNASDDKLGVVAPAALRSIVQRGDRKLLDRILKKDWAGAVARITAFERQLREADKAVPKAAVEEKASES